LFAAAAFAVSPGTEPEPVDFEDTVKVGTSDATVAEAEFKQHDIPVAQVFYSQYGFVVGYVGIESFARNVGERRYENVWGVPAKAYVTDFSGVEPSPTKNGFVETTGNPEWIEASKSVYVIDAGPVVPFSSVKEARDYAKENGGKVREYDALLKKEFATQDIDKVADETVEGLSEEADKKVADTEELLKREVSVTVGEDGDTVQEAIDSAPPNTSVRIPEGVYGQHIVVDKPITLIGSDDTRIVGHRNGTVVTVESDDVAVSSVTLSGVGSETRVDGEKGAGGRWDTNIEEAYGNSDSAILFNATKGSLVHNVTIDTPTTGILFSDVDNGVVTESTVEGAQEWTEGFMGVLAIRSPIVVQNSTLKAGRDGVYSHDSDGLVVRNNLMKDGRFGVHLMFTSGTLIRGNTVRNESTAGIVVMTYPMSNYIVDNDVRKSRNGLLTVGGRSYFADNVLVNNQKGLGVGTRTSVYTRNVVAGNELGLSVSTILPSNKVTRNDFVENGIQVTSSEGAMRVWGDGEAGNYWSNAPRGANSFRPTDPIDSSVTATSGMLTVRRSPAYILLRGLDGVVPGMSSGIVDEDPLEEPVVYSRYNRKSTESSE